MTTISTGGFTLHDGGISYYNNPALEGLLIPVMLAGAIPFKVFFFLYNGNVRGMLRDRTVRILLLIALVGSAIVSFDLFLFGNLSLQSAVREGTFTAISGICTCGLQNSNLHSWATVPLAIVAMLIFIGGAMGSTAGGVKINRVVTGFEGIAWWFRRFFVSSRVIIPLRIGGRTHVREQSNLAISKNLLVIVMYVLTIFLTTILILHLYITSFRLEEVVFEIVSALSNTGLTVGFISYSSPLFLKWVFIALMWLGRLEIAPVVIIAMGIFKEIRDDIAADRDTGSEPEFR
jgi:trk system potassium uptake protein